jgi:hypothetical protein
VAGHVQSIASGPGRAQLWRWLHRRCHPDPATGIGGLQRFPGRKTPSLTSTYNCPPNGAHSL